MESVNLATVQQAKDMGLLESEFEKLKEILGRTPNFLRTKYIWSHVV